MSYQEYPKWVDVKGEAVLVHDAEEEAKATGKAEAALKKAADDREAKAEPAVDVLEEKFQEAVADKGAAVSESDMAKLTGQAQELSVKRGPGRPKKA